MEGCVQAVSDDKVDEGDQEGRNCESDKHFASPCCGVAESTVGFLDTAPADEHQEVGQNDSNQEVR
jgi:hypothetical protein